MKRGKLQGIFDEIQRQNYRLKQQIITLRKHLNTYEQKMMNQLTKIDPKTVIYSTPLQCLEAFTNQLAEITENYTHKIEEIGELEVKVKQWQYKYQICKENSARNQQRVSIYQQKIEEQQQNSKQKQQQLLKQIQQLKETIQKNKYEYQKIQNQLQLKQITIDEEKRVALSAMNYQKQKQMNQFKQLIQKQYLGQSAKLQQQIKQKDEKIRSLLKGLIKNQKGQKLNTQQIGQMRKLVEFIGNIQKLNDEIIRLKDENFSIKKESKDIQNKKSSADLKNIELRNQLSNQIIKYHKKQIQNSSLQQLCVKLKADLKKQQQSTKKLQYYFEVKWHNQFQNVKTNLQKNHSDKVKQMACEVQMKKAQISRKIQSYIFLHQQDKKIIGELKKKVSTSQKKIRRQEQQIAIKDEKIQQLINEMQEMNCMANEDKQSFKQTLFTQLSQKNDLIYLLRKQIKQFCIDKQAYQQRINQEKQQIQSSFQLEKERLIAHYSEQIQTILRTNSQQLTNQRQLHKRKIQQLRNQQLQLKYQYQKQIIFLKQGHRQQLEKSSNILEQQRKNQAEYIAASEVRQKSYKKQLQDLKQYYMKKIVDQQKQLDNKKSTIRVIQDKSDNDENLKRDLRIIIEQKTYEYKQLQKLHYELKDEVEALASEINHLNHENSGLRLNRDDWLKIILEVKDQYNKQFQEMKEIHSREVRILKSKIWELENVILKRPIRIQDQKRIRSLSEQKKELENKIEIKQAENIVLKQIKHYYERQKEVKNCSSEMNLTDANFKKPQTVLIANKRSRRTKMNFYQSMKKSTQQQQQTQNDIIKMRKYLNRCRQSIVPQGQDPMKMLTRLRQTSRVQANFSTQK